jgi:hypothetical protein
MILDKLDEFNKEAGECVIHYADGVFESLIMIGIYLLKRIKKLENDQLENR